MESCRASRLSIAACTPTDTCLTESAEWERPLLPPTEQTPGGRRGQGSQAGGKERGGYQDKSTEIHSRFEMMGKALENLILTLMELDEWGRHASRIGEWVTLTLSDRIICPRSMQIKLH